MLLPLDADSAATLQREYCTPMVTIEPDFMRSIEDSAPLHPGAARNYQEQGGLK